MPGAEDARTITLRGLSPEVTYEVAWDGTDRRERITGADLMRRSLAFERMPAESSALLFPEAL